MTCFSKQLLTGLPLWEKIASPHVVSWIKRGISLPFRGDPPVPYHTLNKYLPPASQSFVTSEIDNLLRDDVIEEVCHKPHCLSPIHCVPKKNGKSRLIHDLRTLNKSCQPPTLYQ